MADPWEHEVIAGRVEEHLRGLDAMAVGRQRLTGSSPIQ
jgi:hypothetical protein